MTDAKGPARAQARGRVRYCYRGHRKTFVSAASGYVCRVCERRHMRKKIVARRKARLAARRARIRARVQPPRPDRIWAAGLFEGEGTVTLLLDRRGGGTAPLVSVVSTDPDVTGYFQDRWPGHVRGFHPKSQSGRCCKAYTWRLHANEKIEGFLLDILPHIRTPRVREKAKLLLADIRDRTQYRRTPAERRRKLARKAKMRELNKRGLDAPRAGSVLGA